MVRDILTIATQTPGELSPLNGAKIIDYEFSSPRMGIPTLTATLMSYKCLDKLWTNREYVTLRGERYYLRDTPTSSKSNTDARYKHDLNFVSEREILNQVYFYDTVESYSFTYDRPCSNSTTFTFYGTIFELVDRINCALLYAGIGDSILKTKTALTTEDIPVGDGYCVMLDPDGDYDPNEVKEMSFTDQYIWSVLTTGYETYKVPFVFKGKACIFGAVDEVIDHTFQYGRKHELMSITKQNANAKLINRITFKGSSENIPYYYPNSSEYGHIDLVAGAGNVGIVLSDLTLENPRKLLAASREGSDIVYGSSNANIKPESVSSWRVEVGGDVVGDVVGGFERNKWYKFELTDEDYTDEDRPTTIPILVGFTFVTTDRGDVVIRELLGQTWLTNDSQPDNDRNMLTDGIEVVGLTNVASRKDYTDHVSTDSNFAMKDLPAGTYDLAVIINVNIVGRRDWRTFFWRISDVIFSGGESRKGWWVDNKFYPSIGNFGIVLREGATPVDGDKFHWTASGRMPFQTNLVPPKYRNTLGAERFYKALNAPYTESYASQHPDAYKDPDTNAPYVFANPFIEGNPDEYIFVDESIKPTIEGITNASGQLFGEIADIAYDSDDSDALKANVNQDDDANTENYAHSFFYIKLNIFNGPYGFDLFAHASQTDAMTLQMTSGKCAGCKFKIQAEELSADEAKSFANPVQTTGPTGTIVDGTYTDKVKTGAAQEWQQNTQTNSIWICVQKDAETFGVIIPNVENNYKPAIGDKFNIINIDLPEAYILAAEKRGEEAMMRYMSDNNEERFDFEIDCSRIFFAQNPDILADLSESSKIRVAYDGETYELYVSNMAISCKADEPLPNVKLTLAKDLTVGQSFAERVAARVASLIATPYNLGGALGTGNAALTDRRYLNKQKNDRTPYKLSSSTAFELGEFISGSSGGMFGVDKESGRTFLETDILRVRMKAVFERLEVVEANSVSGKTVITPGGGIEISFVEPRYEGNDLVSYRCYFKTEEDGKEGGCRFRVGDLIYCQDFKIENGVVTGDMSGVSGNHYYWRNLIAVSNENSYFDLSATDCDTLSDAPQAGDTVIQLGSKNDNTRQSAIIFSTVDASAPSVTLFHGINTYSLNQKEVVAYGVDKTKTPPEPFFNCYGRFYFGPRSKASYLQFEPSEGSLVFKGKLSVESSVGDQSLLDFIKENGGLNEDVENFVNQVIQGVQDQIDGVIETWFYNGVPTLSNYPAIEWDTDDLKIQHLGDLYYDNDTGTAYRFSQNAQGAYFWNVITDDAITKALAAAQKAQDTADGKRRVFTAQPTPPYDNGDLWVNATYPAGTTATTRDPSQNKYYLDILRCSTSKASGTTFSISDWVLASNYTDDTVAKQALSQIAGYEYIKNALLPENPTQIAGGLIMSTLISLGYTQDGERKNMAGLNGSWVDSLGGRTIAAWFGGPMIDRFDAQGNKITPIPANAATTLIRMDGSAYFAGGNVGFNSDGSGWLGNYDNGIRFDSVGGMTFGSGIKIALTSGDKGLKETLESLVNFMAGLGTAFIPEDSSGNKVAWNSNLLNRVRLTKGFYSDSFISAHGLNATGGSGGSGASTLAMLTDVQLTSPVAGQALVYNGSKWVNQTVAAQAGVTELGVSGNYLTWTKNSAVHNLTVPYATAAQSLAGSFYVFGGTEKPNAAIFGGSKLRLQMLSCVNLGLPRSVSYWYDVLWLSAYASGDVKASSALAFPKNNTSREIYLFSQDSDSEEWDSTPAKILTDANFDTTLGSAYVKKSGDTMTGQTFIDTRGKTDTPMYLISHGANCYLGMRNGDSTLLGYYGATVSGPVWNKGSVNYTLWHSGNDGAGSDLDADLLDGQHLSDILASNVASATKLADNTAFSVWGQTFFENGKPKNVSGDMTGVGSITASRVIQTNEDVRINQPSAFFQSSNGVWNLALGITVGGNAGLLQRTRDKWILGYSDSSLNTWLGVLGNVGIGTTSPAYKLDVSGTIHTNNKFRRSTYAGAAWNNGYGAFEVEIGNNYNQTPLIVALRAGSTNYEGTNNADRLFAMEFRNADDYTLHFSFGGAMKFAMYRDGQFHATSSIRIGSAILTYDASTDMIKCNKGFYSEGAISAHGSSSGTSGGSGGNLSNFSFGKANSSDTYNTKLSITVGEITKSVTGVASTAEVAALQTLVNLYNTAYDGRFATSLSLSGSTLSLLKNNGGVLSSVTLPSASSGGSSTGAAGSLQYFTEQQFYESALGIGPLNSLVPTTLIGCIGTPAKPLRMLYTKEIMGLTDITAANYWPEVPGSSALGGTGDRFGVGYINDLYINRLFVNGTQITSFGGGTAGGTKLSISGSTLSLLNSSNTVLSSVTLPTSSGGGGGTSSNLNYLNVTLNNGYVEIDNSAGNYPMVIVSGNTTTGTAKTSLHVGSSGARGVWDLTYAAWLISTDGDLTQIMTGNRFYVGSSTKSIPSTFYGGYSSGSDIRLKNVEEYLSIPIESVANAPFFRFSWKSDGRVDVGTSAQYWQSVAPFVVYHPDEYLTMSYDKAALISVISVAKETINLKERVKQLEEEVKNLKEQQSCETTDD